MTGVELNLNPAEQQLKALLQARGKTAAARELAMAGLPARRVESYHYTDVKSLIGAVPPLAVPTVENRERFVLPRTVGIVLSNGRLDGDFGIEAVQVSTVANGASDDDLVALIGDNLADGVVEIGISGEIDAVLHVDRVVDGSAATVSDKVVIRLDSGAKATLVESFGGSNEAHLRFASTEVIVGENAEFVHIQLDRNSATTRHFAFNHYNLAGGAQLRTFVQHTNARLARSVISADFCGEKAHADFSGLNLLAENQHADFTLQVNHTVPDTTSTENFRHVVCDRARAVFQGKIVVAPDAQKTDAKMMSQGLILSERGEVMVKPELEIFADDVICAHGATCGELDESALFYLMSRGISRARAQAILVRAFLAAMFEPIAAQPVVDFLEVEVDKWLEQRDKA